jgi:ABC-type multidrug transport system fused ATPase/permease subunit
LLAQLSFSLQAAILFIQTIRIQLVLAERMLETLDVQPEVQDAPDAMDIPPVKGRIEFRNVRFGYVPGKEVLRGVGFSIEPGSFVVLTGSAASGKSTVLNLIERFHDPDSGEVLIDGQNVRNVTQRSLRKNIGLAFQEPLLCSGTILQNFRYGAPHASLDEVRKVAHVVDLDSFIESLEKGYDTPVSEAGNLSGGQKQRLALGRTLLSNTPILLLDQPTSALDAKTEETVIRRLREFVRGKTVLMVTHSLRNARVADRILLFDEGQLVAQGTHDQLLASSLLYAQMWATEGDSREQGD